ncbi:MULTISPECIES: ParB/RepB/Spo0J family partition protein [unclassified Facklamia]|uniref:ParB/RepB/Spo0J family partition protein n=1 Tax=Aerococcaceae TaxID=186827 RepID=UPI0013BA46AF|nr:MULTISPECIES: ParB/RepB/Spo0J family partition protein [unclassified Facklamia]MBS4462722.1 ParB/RepB/Spo0J family partition protein [Aerococcaceae bacterium zg-B36]NEW65107.1 ParB/RepB/Spo0J family partition protein [Facklamia sp. 252]NEW68637.1 ParB/RepB/Spo0J family partition protein [Facklamia sp. 253]QQD65504.1 ParB/RepB/Spo0J family partition protein [Aerococcaceae bacterium zg-252]
MANKNKKGGLGRGMDALFSNYDDQLNDNEIVEELALSEIRSNPYQPRKKFEEAALQELANSIKQSGVFQPIIVRQSSVKGYELIAGERRVRASRLAGKETIPAIVRQIDEEQMIEIAVLENLQREDLSPMEEAEAYNVLMVKLNLTQNEVAERMGKSRPYIANYLRLLSLPEQIKQWVNNGDLSMGLARTLLSIKNKDKQIEIAKKVIEEQLTVRQLEELVQSLSETPEIQKPTSEKDKTIEKPAYLKAIENRMQEYFGTHAVVQQKGEKGKIEIEFLSQSDLIRILDLLNIHL